MIGFESLIDCYLGALFAKVVNDLIEKYKILDWVILIIINNVYNNGIMVKELNSYINEAINKGLFKGNIICISCLLYVI
jgi:uncharacterized NAD-dependent epimerase/dehydratase family protein